MSQNLDDADFIQELRMGFCLEAIELLDDSEMRLLRIETTKIPDDFNSLKRNFHSLKGSSNAAGLEVFSHAAHQMESRLPTMTNLNRSAIDQALQACDAFRGYIQKVRLNQKSEAISDLQKFLKSIGIL